ncbi:hypothetical protein SCHPADRAFT_923945 [Schizopora paradoxa]|uniref:Amidohydrolase-related domain-containing protein n=1 Tax=Schizopora paradoxa TaxID=27342 RepID=A0A0H2S856_9AGAM|nr:hypothetical protein SCHPADRAFT_923945 [Schizopora paradoxa]
MEKYRDVDDDEYVDLEHQWCFWHMQLGKDEKKRVYNFRFKLNRVLCALVGLLFILLEYYIVLPLAFGVWSRINGRSVKTLKNTWPAADAFKDDIWPIRQPTPWDISTDFPYPRRLEFDTSEGTWMRLDVHPQSGEIIFDLLGDIYCLPSTSYANRDERSVTEARPVLLGVPHDSDPHFSPDGSLLAFRSDAELGVENIWVTEWKGCDEMSVRPKFPDAQMADALRRKDDEADDLAKGIKETSERRSRRLTLEGRSLAHRVTNETYRWVSDPRFHPSGQKLIATKWYFSSRSLGAGEGWEYPIPSRHENVTIGSGSRVVGRTLPVGWSTGFYGQQQIGPEQSIWYGNDSIIFAKNTADTSGTFLYSKDVHSGIYSIFMYNTTTSRITKLVDSFPGSASRPELSHDGQTMAFVRRVRDKEALVLKDLHSGTIHHVWYGLTYDATAISAPMGTYPSFSFTPSDDAIIIWAAGKIWHVPLATNSQGEKIARSEESGEPKTVEFIAHVEKRIAETRREEIDLLTLETQEEQRLHAFKDLDVADDGSRVVFQGSGVNYFVDVSESKRAAAKKVPVLHPSQAYYSPSFVPGKNDLVIQARWSDTTFSSLELADLSKSAAYEVSGLDLGRYIHPILCTCTGSKRSIAFIKTGGDLLTGDVVATANPGLYTGELTLPDSASFSKEIIVTNIKYIPTNIPIQYASNIRFEEGNKVVVVTLSGTSFAIDVQTSSSNPDKFGNFNTTYIESGAFAHEIAHSKKHIAFVDFFNVFVVQTKDAVGRSLSSKPGASTPGLARVSLDGGHGIRWDGEGKRLFWLLGPYLHSIEVSKLSQCSSAIKNDDQRFGVDCITHLLDVQEIVVTYSTDISRLRQDAQALRRTEDLRNADVLAITNAKILTMRSGEGLVNDLIQDGVLLVQEGVIKEVGSSEDIVIPLGASTIDAHGGFVVPGFIDVHAHWSGFADPYPAKSWEMTTFLAYGVTTLHKLYQSPSSDNVEGFVERGRVENGGMIGPRIYHTGNVIYGAQAPRYHNDVADMHDAISALIRIKVEGGPASYSYKNYNQYSRASRQRLLLAARNLSMLCVPEGGMNQDWDLTYIIDGMTTVEHNLPIPELYDDVLTLYAKSGTGATPTHIVNYGGAHGEQFVWANYDVPNDSKLRTFTDHSILEMLSESTSRPLNSYTLFNTSSSIAKMVKKGMRAHIGAHGEPPLGLNYHAEMFFASQGGLDNYEVVRAATLDAAITLGIDSAVGSLKPGKLADFVVYPPGFDITSGDITKSKDIRFVARGGRLWDASTMVEEWPRKGFRQSMPAINAD